VKIIITIELNPLGGREGGINYEKTLNRISKGAAEKRLYADFEVWGWILIRDLYQSTPQQISLGIACG